MRIILNGQQPFGAEVLGALARGEDVVAVYCAPDRPGRGADPLKEAALDAAFRSSSRTRSRTGDGQRDRAWTPT